MTGPTLDDLRPTASVRRVVGGFGPDQKVAAGKLIQNLLALHPDYGHGLAGKVRIEAEPDGWRSPLEWLTEARALYVDAAAERLNTRMTVLGLGLLVPELAHQLQSSGLLDALVNEIAVLAGKPISDLLTPGADSQLGILLSAPGRPNAPPPPSSPRKSPPVSPPGFSTRPAEIHIALKALGDSPTSSDNSLGFADYADALANFIESPETSRPLTLGIDAAWGMGKTSLMYMIRERLDPGASPKAGEDGPAPKFSRFRTVWFNAWKYDKEEALWAALVLEILGETRRRSTLTRRIRTWIRLNWERLDGGLFVQDALTGILKPLFFLMLGALASIAGLMTLLPDTDGAIAIPLLGALGLSAVYSLGKTTYQHFVAPFDLNISRYIRTPKYEEKVGFLAEFQKDFRRVIRVVTENGKWPVVVFVDDLDRCAPTKAVEVIEAMNTVLDTEHSVFVLGMDGDAVAASIEAKYKDLREHLPQEPGGLRLGERFLEKIVQINFRIPRAEPRLVHDFIGDILGSDAAPRPEPVPDTVRTAEHLILAQQRVGSSLEEATREVKKSPEIANDHVDKARRRIDEQATAEAEHVRVAVVEAAPYLDFNPRKIKRFVNTFRLHALIARRRGLLSGEQEVRRLARAVMVAMCWPDFVDAVLNEPNFTERLEEAHRVRRELVRLRGLTAEEEAVLRRPLEASLNNWGTDPARVRMTEASELIDLLAKMDAPERLALCDFLSLARPTRSAASSPGPAVPRAPN